MLAIIGLIPRMFLFVNGIVFSSSSVKSRRRAPKKSAPSSSIFLISEPKILQKIHITGKKNSVHIIIMAKN